MRRLTVATLAVLTVGVVSACGGNDDDGIRQGKRTTPTGMLADEDVLAQMRSTDSGGRIVYAPPPDLSLSSAELRRPDLFRAPGAPAAPAAAAARPAPRDTTTAEGATGRARNP
jgi:hypothetical protein